MEFETTVEIAATPARVWDVHVAVESWPEWTASMRRVQRLDPGPLSIGSRARIKQPGMPAMVWEVSEFEPLHKFSWGTSRWAMQLSAEHLIAAGFQGTTVTLIVRTSGFISRLTDPFTSKRARKFVDLEAAGLKQRCEGSV